MKDWRSLATLMQLGWVFAFAVLLPLGLGVWLDRVLRSSPLFLLIGALLGIVTGTVGAIRIATRAIAEVERQHADQGAERKED